MPSCVLRYCKNNSTNANKAMGISFHRFLHPAHKKREEWITFVQINRSESTWLPSEHTYICSEHFRDEDFYVTKTGRRFLKKSAVPCDNPKASTENNRNISPICVITEYVSDSESIFDTPGEIRLKIELAKITKAKDSFKKKAKKLQRQNKILRVKNEKLIAIVKELKKKLSTISDIEQKLLKKA